MINIPIEKLIPHRERMKLVDEILQAEDGMAVSLATVTDQWPLQDGLFVSSLILVELIAQTAAIAIGWKELKESSNSLSGKGWLVGIKTATFLIDKIPVHSRITTRSETTFCMDQYTEVVGRSTIGDITIGEAVLQVMREKEVSNE